MVSRRGVGQALVVLALTMFFTGTLGIGPGLAQGPGIVIDGRVLWVAAETMVIAPYEPTGGASAINVDLSQADQDEYAGLRTGDAVTVAGTVAPDGDRVIATSIRRLL